MNPVGFRPCTRMHTDQLLRYVKSLSHDGHDCQFKLSATEALAQCFFSSAEMCRVATALLDTGSGKNVPSICDQALSDC